MVLTPRDCDSAGGQEAVPPSTTVPSFTEQGSWPSWCPESFLGLPRRVLALRVTVPLGEQRQLWDGSHQKHRE